MERACIYYLGSRSIPVDDGKKTIGSDSGGRVQLLPPEIECIEYLVGLGYALLKYPMLPLQNLGL